MSDPQQHDDHEWDQVIDSLASGVDDLSQEEIRSELKEQGIDVTPAVDRVKRAIRARKARSALAEARARRSGLVDRIRQAVGTVSERREELKEVIQRRLSGEARAAYWNRLQEADNEEDLRSLVEDLEALDALESFEREQSDTDDESAT